MFSVKCHDALFVGSARGPHELENSALMFRATNVQEHMGDPQIAPDTKIQVLHHMSRHAFFGLHIGLTRA
jgi:hypothetical protein